MRLIHSVLAVAVLASASAACATATAPPLMVETARAEAAPVCIVADNFAAAGPGRDDAFTALDTAGRAALLQTLPDCLEHPDPAVRDGYAFEILSLILRSGDQATESLRPLMTGLLDRLASANADPNGFRGPFAALALAEVARVDRVTPFLSEEERWDMLMAAKAYLAELTDYRGFSEGEGWRHGVAHTADLLMQMSLNAHLTKPQAEEILSAIALQVGTPDHAYIFGESERLAAPVTYLAFKETFTAEEWSTWFAGLWAPEDPLREDIYKSEAALTKLHNLRAFAQSVYINAMASHDDRMKPVAGAAFEFLNQLP